VRTCGAGTTDVRSGAADEQEHGGDPAVVVGLVDDEE